jgi:hypothetical protein
MQKRKFEGRLEHAFAAAVAIDRHDFLSAPVREPEAMVVPARRLALATPVRSVETLDGEG